MDNDLPNLSKMCSSFDNIAINFLLSAFLQVTSPDDKETNCPLPNLDEFTCKLQSDDARVLVDLLKLAVAQRAGGMGQQGISDTLTAMAKAYPEVRRGNIK